MTEERDIGSDRPASPEPGDRLMVAALDRLVPAVDALPAAGAMGVPADILRMTADHPAFAPALGAFAAALSRIDGFAGLTAAQQDAALYGIEAALPGAFATVLQLVYIAYYRRPDVQARIGWRPGPLQPQGFELPPFDEASLDRTRRRAPFWRQA